MLNTQPITVADFSGGIVDDYINAPPNRAQVQNNLVVLEDKSALMRPGSVIDDVEFPLTSEGNERVGYLMNFDQNDALLVFVGTKVFTRDPDDYAELTGPNGLDPFDAGDAASILAASQWNGHAYLANGDFARPVKVYRDSSGDLQVRNAGLPALATSPTCTAGAAGARNYIYAFHYSYEYTVGDETFLDEGPVMLVELASSAEPSGGTPNPITNIPVLANTSNWQTAGAGRIKVQIFRSLDGGTTLYSIGEVNNGTTSFSDTFGDSAIEDNETIYTEGGVLDNDTPPLAKYVHIVQNKAYYAHLQEGSEILPSDILQSVADDPDSVPSTNRDRVEDRITGLSSVRELPIVLCRKRIYRIDGEFDELGRGFMSHVTIHATAGCVSNNSCVQAEQGLFWAGNDGIYYTDGVRCFKVTDQINQTYRELIAAASETGDLERITGRFDEENRRIIWTVQTDSSSEEQDTFLVLDLRSGVSDQMPVTTWDGGDSFRPSAIEFFNGELYRGDSRGYVFVHSHNYTTDPKVDTAADASDWFERTIVYQYKSIASNLGTDFVRKWVPRMLLTLKNRSNISVQINVINDDGEQIRNLAEIRYRKNFDWGNPEFSWGDEDCVWRSEGLIEEWRRFPKRGLRLSYLQVEITNAYTIVASSDLYGDATIAKAVATTPTLTLDEANVEWPENSVDYYLSFAADNYEREYLVTGATPTELTYLDTAQTSPAAGSTAWLLKGYKKGEVINILSYTLHVAALTATQTNNAGQNTGANA